MKPLVAVGYCVCVIALVGYCFCRMTKTPRTGRPTGQLLSLSAAVLAV